MQASTTLTTGQIARRVMRGVALLGVSQYLTIGIGILKMAILARTVPVDIFGVVALAATYVSFLSVFQLELRPVVVTSPQHDERRVSVQYFLENASAAIGILLVGLIYILLPGLAGPLVWRAIFILMGIRIVGALTSTHLYMLERDIRHDLISRFNLIGALLGMLAATLLALASHPLLGLLADAALLMLASNIGAVFATRWRPMFAWDSQIAKATLGFGFTLWTSGLLGKVTFDFDDWLVGTFQGVTIEGYYSRAYNLAKMPLDIFGGIIASVSGTLYAQSREAGDEVLRQAYALTTWLLTRVIFLSSVVLFVGAEDLITVVLGRAWLPIAPLIRLMFLFVIGRPLFQNNGILLVALRHEKQFRRTVISQALILITFGPPAVFFANAAGVSIVVSIMMLVGLIHSEILVQRIIGVNGLRLYVIPFALAIILIPSLFALGNYLHLPALLSLLLKAAVASITFIGAIILFERDRSREFMNLAQRHFLTRESRED